MPSRWRNTRFDPEQADEHGLVAWGGTLAPELLVEAYRAGVFPWSSRPVVTWWSPDPRCIFDLDAWRPHKSVARSVRRGEWRFTVDGDFEGVMRGCAEPAEGREETWITDDFVTSYCELHRRGSAHSVEVWEGDALIGGVYGVSLGAFFGAESMFKRRTDASKAAIGFLIEQLRAGGYQLLDAQVPNPHLMYLGAVEISRRDYLARLREALRGEAHLPAAPRAR